MKIKERTLKKYFIPLKNLVPVMNAFRKLKHIKLISAAAFMISISASCVTPGAYAQTPDEKVLFTAVLTGNLIQAEKLLKSGSKPDARGANGNTILTTACHASNAGMVDLLLKYKADPNMRNTDGTVPLNYCIKPFIIKKLIDKGADVFLIVKNGTAFENWCSLQAYIMTEAQKKQSLNILKQQKINITRAQMEKLYWLTESDLAETVRLYQSKGYDINKSYNSSMNTPLHLAAYNDNYNLMKILIKAGASAERKNKINDDALNIITRIPESAKSEKEYKTMLSLLLSAGADINGTDTEGETPLANAAKADKIGKIRSILAVKGVIVNKTGSFGETALFKARSFSATKALVLAGINVNFANPYGVTAIFNVTDPESVKFLIEKGADIHHVDIDKENILVSNMRSAYSAWKVSASEETINARYTGKIKILISRGININYADPKGHTALDWASRAPFTKICDLLKKSGAR